jgi:hypothetical protein
VLRVIYQALCGGDAWRLRGVLHILYEEVKGVFGSTVRVALQVGFLFWATIKLVTKLKHIISSVPEDNFHEVAH